MKRRDGPGARRTQRALARGAKQSARMRSLACCAPPEQDRWRRLVFHNTATSSAVLIRLRLPSHSGFKSPVSGFVPRLRRGYLCYSSSRCKSKNKHVTKSSHLGVRLSGSRRASFTASYGPCHLQGARQSRKQAMNNLLTNEARLFAKPRGACPRKTFSLRPPVRSTRHTRCSLSLRNA